jgi:hypothetical protein
MTIVDLKDGNLDITLTGWDRFWTLKRHLAIPLAHITSVAVQSPKPPRNWKTIKAPGSYWPGKIQAGSFWSWDTHEWSFWNVRNADRVVVIDLDGEKYRQIVLEVDSPEHVADKVKRAISKVEC